jgi:glucuronate isomerase
MRANGVAEEYVTGRKPSYERFLKWAETMPYLMRNPLYHWTHLELKQIFGISKVLNPDSAREIYEEATEKLQSPAFSACGLLQRMRVEVLCTTDDPADDLRWHRLIREKGGCSARVLPTWRPDKAAAVEEPATYRAYLARLEAACGKDIRSYDALLEALQQRHDFFAEMGCRASDHGLESFPDASCTEADLRAIFRKVREGKTPDASEAACFRAALLYEGARMDARAGWVQQFHVGANRNNNGRLFRHLGPDAGCDAIADGNYIAPMNRFFDRLDSEGLLAKTILYNLNPRDNVACMANAYNFNDGSLPGKMQYGAAWWFLDQVKGIEAQLETLSALGLLSRFVGMVTDSRSFLSYPRHDYFRRILCNLLGRDLERGLLPVEELPFIGRMVEAICHDNAKSYFGF